MKRTLLLITALVFSLLLSAQSLVPQVTVEQEPQTDALYRLPFDKGVACVAYSLTPVRLNLARNYNLVDFCAWELVVAEPSVVVAPRAGVVEAVTDSGVLIRHEDGIYTRLRALNDVVVAEGQSVEKGETVARLGAENGKGGYGIWMEVVYITPNPDYGTEALGGKGEHLTHYINPIFSSRGKCKVQLTNGNSYTVKARTWCWPWE